jgi:hypothetical protein
MKNAGLQLSPQRAEPQTLKVKVHLKASTGNTAGSEGLHLGDSASSLTGQSFSRASVSHHSLCVTLYIYNSSVALFFFLLAK